MKIREKLFLILLAIIILFTVVFNVVVLNIFQKELQREKLETVQNTLEQILLSYEYASSDLSDYIFDSVRREEIALEIQHQREDPLPLKMKLKNVIRNNSTILDGFVCFEDQLLTASDSQNAEAYRQNWEDGLFDRNQDTLWVRDEAGRLYFRQNIYQNYPYRLLGSAVFEIDKGYLRSLIGMGNIGCGKVCIIDAYGNVLLMSAGVRDDDPLFEDILQKIFQGETLKRNQNYDGEAYHVIAVNNSAGQEKALFAVSDHELLRTFYVIRRYLYQLAFVMLLCAAFLSFSVSHGFTKNLRMLRNRVNVITHDSNQNLSQRIELTGKDEIGELSSDINRLLSRLEEVHNISLQHLKASQDARYELLEWKFRFLQSQVSPHFLCNIMSSLAMLSAAGKPKAVQKLAVDASRYLRNNLSNCDKKENTVREEIQIIRDYIAVVNAISAVPMELLVRCPEELMGACVPTYTLQPLIENSVKHGIAAAGQECLRMTVEIGAAADMLQIKVRDNGIGYKDSVLQEISHFLEDPSRPMPEIGIGTLGIVRRLKLMYDSRYRLRACNLPEGGACTTLAIPLTTRPTPPDDAEDIMDT